MKKWIVALILVIIVGFLAIEAGLNFNDTAYDVTVTRVERVVTTENGEIDSKYLVYCEKADGGVIVFKNTDNILRGKWNSSDIYGRIKEGNSYRFTVIGVRIPFLSMYQNIIKVERL